MSRRFIATVTCTLLLVTTLHSADEPAKPSKPTADRVKIVRQMYEKLPCEILGLTEPLKQLRTRIASDGGSVGIDVVDATDKKLSFGLDRRLAIKTHDTLLGNLRLPPRGPEESAVYGLLLRWSAKPPDKTPKADIELVGEVLKELDERFAGAMPIAEKQADK